jgi:hypothetical protein
MPAWVVLPAVDNAAAAAGLTLALSNLEEGSVPKSSKRPADAMAGTMAQATAPEMTFKTTSRRLPVMP